MPSRLDPDAAPAAEHGTRRWRIGADAALQLRQWDGEFVVFNPRSGHTHFLDVAAGRLLQWLADQAHPEDELARLMAAELGLPADADVQEPLRLLLEQLDEQGLIDAC